VQLFRSEVLGSSTGRLHGEVIFSQPLSTKLFVGALFSIVAISGVWVSIGTYARIETVPGMLVTSVPSAKVVALQPGVVSELAVQEGQLVRSGERLLVINSDRGVDWRWGCRWQRAWSACRTAAADRGSGCDGGW
jgi:membrane fusion protein